MTKSRDQGENPSSRGLAFADPQDLVICSRMRTASKSAGIRDRVSTEHGRIIIAGTGRAGTTFLVQLFSALGFGTGFSLEQARHDVDEVSHAGLEKTLVNDTNPYVIKSPWFADELAAALQEDRIKLYAALLPVRDLFSAAESRRRVYDEAESRGLDPDLHPGSLWPTDQPENQEDVLARKFYATIFPLIQFDIPVYLLEFPRLIREPNYLFGRLEMLMSDHGVSHSEFLQAHNAAARPELIHDFENYPRRVQLEAATGGSAKMLAARQRELLVALETIRLERVRSEGFERDLTNLRVEIQDLAARKRSLQTQYSAAANELADLRAENKRLIADHESLLNENGAISVQGQQQARTHQSLLNEIHSLWESSSWRLFRPLRNLFRRLRGYQNETEPSPTSTAEALRTVLTIRDSFSWEVTAPLRSIHRTVTWRRRSLEAMNPTLKVAAPLSLPDSEVELISAVVPDPRETVSELTRSEVFSYMSETLEPAALPKRVWIGASSLGNFFMTEIARSLQHAFTRLGAETRLFTELDRHDVIHSEDTVIVVAPHEFFHLGEGRNAFEVLRRLPNLVMINTEQPQTQWFAVAQEYLNSASTVLDINYQSARLLANLGHTVLFLPLGYSDYVANTYSGQDLPDHDLLRFMRHSDLMPLPVSYSDRPIDVLFIGTSSPRRNEFFAQNAGYFSSIKALIYMPDSRTPLRSDESRTVDFATFVALVKRSKILLNIHRDDVPYLEWQRIVTLGIM